MFIIRNITDYMTTRVRDCAFLLCLSLNWHFLVAKTTLFTLFSCSYHILCCRRVCPAAKKGNNTKKNVCLISPSIWGPLTFEIFFALLHWAINYPLMHGIILITKHILKPFLAFLHGTDSVLLNAKCLEWPILCVEQRIKL